ncbi:hypothetical protein YC2023_002582 [Brassica napus]
MENVPGSFGTGFSFALRSGQIFGSSTLLIFMCLHYDSYDFNTFWCDEYFCKAERESSHRKKPSAYIASLRWKPRAFVVFRQDPGQMMGSYTQEISDLCIFLSKSEAFYVSATEYPGLKPNSVYFASLFTRFGLYDLSSNTSMTSSIRPLSLVPTTGLTLSSEFLSYHHISY